MEESTVTLAIFTILMQYSAGLTLITWLTDIFGSNPGEVRSSLRVHSFSALIIALVALAVSFIHLASPLNSVNSLLNLRYSWLSREILLTVLYLTALLFLAASEYRGKMPAVRSRALPISAILGTALVWVMSKVYMLPAIPALNIAGTQVSFISASLVGGTSLLLVIYIFFNNADKGAIALLLIISAFVSLCNFLFFFMLNSAIPLLAAIVILLYILPLAILILKSATGTRNNLRLFAVISVTLLLAAEFLNRLLLFSHTGSIL